MEKITIDFDVEKKEIHKVEGTEKISPIDIARVLVSVAHSTLNRIELKPANKLVTPNKKIVGLN